MTKKNYNANNINNTYFVEKATFRLQLSNVNENLEA
jgi:hypothetical protein